MSPLSISQVHTAWNVQTRYADDTADAFSITATAFGFLFNQFYFQSYVNLTRSTQEETDDLNRFLYGPDAFSVIQTTVLKCWSNSVS